LSQDTPAQEPDRPPVPVPVPEPEPTADRAPEPVAGPAAEPVAGPAIEPVAEPAPYKPRRRGRTTLLIAVAAVLGAAAGGGLGYRIQENREPTPLAPLTGPVLAQPKGAGPAAPKLTASQDAGLLYQGSLLKLLVPTPKGDKEGAREWTSLLDYADGYTQPDHVFHEFVDGSYQRGVHVGWTDKHHDYYGVGLTQFRDEVTAFTPTWFDGQRENNDALPQDGPEHHLTDVRNAGVWGSAKPHQKSGYLPEYEGRGIAQVGNIYVEVFVDSLHPVKADTVKSVLEKQLERL
jgi:hypothetical protein